MRVVMVTPEVAPLATTGGLGDVAAALPGALRALGIDAAVVLPGYRRALEASRATPTGTRIRAPISNRVEDADIYRATLANGTPVFLLRADRYFDRDELYGTAGDDYPDNAERFAFFARAALASLDSLGVPDVLHCHDWQSALAPAFLRAGASRYPHLQAMRTALTIHNLGYQGVFWGMDWHLLNLDPAYFTPRFLEFYGQINYLKAGIVFADAITTVSRGYAEEIQTPAYGSGLEGVLQERRSILTGILNGADYAEWSPDVDRHLPCRYDASDPSGKSACKAALQREFGLPERAEIPLLGMVTRLAKQKGIDLLLAAGPRLLRRAVQVVLLGDGNAAYAEACAALARRHPRRFALRIGFDTALAHRVEAGADMFLMPSMYEPCGLNQIYSLRYGTVPIVHATGGLKDTVREFDPVSETGNGFAYVNQTVEEFLAAIDRARGCFRRAARWRLLVRNAMSADFSWDRSAQEYARLYERLAASPTAGAAA